jgi:hypothetical protein
MARVFFVTTVLAWLAICNIGLPRGNRLVDPALCSTHLREGLWR